MGSTEFRAFEKRLSVSKHSLSDQRLLVEVNVWERFAIRFATQSLSKMLLLTYMDYAFRVSTVPYLCEKLNLLLVFIKEREKRLSPVLISPSASAPPPSRSLPPAPPVCVRVRASPLRLQSARWLWLCRLKIVLFIT